MPFNIFSQTSWRISDDGWVMRKKNTDKDYEKFFAIGLWGIPGYDYTNKKNISLRSDLGNQKIFRDRTENFNLVYMHTNNVRSFMNTQTLIVGTSEIPWYLNHHPILKSIVENKGSVIDQRKRIENLKGEVRKKIIKDAISYIDKTLLSQGLNNFIWAPIDEVVGWPISVTEQIFNEIKKYNNDIVFIDLLGNGYDRPFSAGGGRYLRSQVDKDSFFDFWYNNVSSITSTYLSSGDIFGVNSFNDFYKYPFLVGLTVDAIFEGAQTKDIAVWIFFDSNGYSKPVGVKVEDFYKNIKCQVYTSIVHGATGVIFWNDLTKRSLSDSLEFLVGELKINDVIFKGFTLSKYTRGDIHCLTKKTSDGSMYMIATNTSKDSNNVFYHNESGSMINLSPLQVLVRKL
jgi:hypothetical protein